MTAGTPTIYRGIPVLPLRNVVVLPGALRLVHLFEHRYRRLVEDLLDTQGRLVLAAPVPDAGEIGAAPPLRPLGTLVEIASHRRLAEGRYLVWLLGLDRVHLREVPSRRPYRRVDAVVLPDRPGDPRREATLLPRLRAAVAAELVPDPAVLAELDLGLLADLLLQALARTPAEREHALLERDAARRAEMALGWLARSPARRGDPPAGDAATE